MDVRFFGLAHSHDNGRPVATFPPTAPPQDMLTRRGWSIVVILIIGKANIEFDGDVLERIEN